MNTLLKKNILQKKPSHEACCDFFEIYKEEQEKTICEWINLKRMKQTGKGITQKWETAPAGHIHKLLHDFTRLGIVRDEKGLEQIKNLFVKNIAILLSNTELSGHTQLSPEEIFEDYGYSRKDAKNIFEYFYDIHAGQYRISDYAMNKLIDCAFLLCDKKTTDIEAIQIIDHILNITHQRSDLSSWFVEGGIATLNKIFDGDFNSERLRQNF